MHEEQAVEKLCAVITESNLTPAQVVIVMAQFLYSMGASLENYDPVSSEDVLKRYALKPTLGNALMAQAIWMKETWNTERKDDNGGEEFQGETERE